jgi:hypothetical protein
VVVVTGCMYVCIYVCVCVCFGTMYTCSYCFVLFVLCFYIVSFMHTSSHLLSVLPPSDNSIAVSGNSSSNNNNNNLP